MRYSVRELVYVGVFGGLWGAIEISAGSALHALAVPFAGLLLGAAGLTIALVGRLYVPRPGSVLVMALVTAFLKMFSVGGVVVTPIIGILMEGVLAEGSLLLFGSSRAGFAVSGAVATLWPLVQPFVTQGLLGGVGVLGVYDGVLRLGGKLFGLTPASALAIVALLVAMHAAAGVLAAMMAWRVGTALRARGHQWTSASPSR